MGLSSSKNLGAPIGSWITTGKPIYKRDEQYLGDGIAEGRYMPVTDVRDLEPGWELWFVLYNPQRKYARRANGFKTWWANHRSDIASKLSSSTRIAIGTASSVAAVAMPIIIDAGTDAATNVIKSEFPELAPIAPTIVRILSENMKGMAQTATQSFHGAGETDDFAYRDSMNLVKSKMSSNVVGAYDGSCGCRGDIIGSDETDLTTVRNYSDSVNSKTKEQIIDNILDIAAKLGMNVSGADHQAKIKSLIADLQKTERIKSSDETHRKVCQRIAEAINSTYGNQIIDKNLPADVICQQAAEIIASLAAGMHSEFLAVYNDVRKVLRNLHILKQSLDDQHKAFMDKVKNSDDSLLSQQVTTLSDLHKILTSEIERQIQLLSNLLNVTLFPSDKTLAQLIKSKKDIYGHISKIDVKIGSEKFGRVISDILKGLGVTANFALLIDRALKTVGISIDEYAKSDSVKNLREHITKNLLGKTMNEKELHDYLEAAELLYKNFYRNQDIARALGQKTGKYEGAMGYSGGDGEVYRKTVMDKRIADRKKLRNLIFNAFYQRLNELFDNFVNNLDILTKKVGTEIPLSDQLNSLRIVLKMLSEDLFRNKYIYYALIGYYNDAMSKSKKDAAIGNLKMINSYIDTIIEMPLYSSSKQYFAAVQDQIKAMIDLIDKFSDEIAAKFGRGENGDPECSYLDVKPKRDRAHAAEPDDNIADIEEEKEGAYEFPDAVYGGDSMLERPPELRYKSGRTIHDAIRQFDYNCRVAQIRSNLAVTSKELDHYTEKYEKIIANSIADILEEDRNIYTALRKQLTEDKEFGPASDYVVTHAIGFDNDAAVEAERKAALKMLDHQWDVKKRFWATVEAVDTYMRIFTDGLVKNPNDIKDIKAMLDGITIVADWYNERTGEEQAGVFEHFPSFMFGGDAVYSESLRTAEPGKNVSKYEVVYPPAGYSTTSGITHYYEKIATQLKTTPGAAPHTAAQDVYISALPGNPYLVTIPTKGEIALNQAKKTLNGLAILKNLLSVFISVGSKFGGQELRKKVFMTPTQMYNNLIDFLYTSAFAQGFGVGDPFVLIDGKLPTRFSDLNDLTVPIDTVTGGLSSEIPDRTYPVNSRCVSLGVSPLTTTANSGVAAQRGIYNATLFKKRWGVWMRSVIPELQAHEGFSFRREDSYFVILLKSLAAKVLTVTGMYDVLDRPMEFNGLSPIRMITGGALETPKVEEGAVALYLRLPLLAQFYRSIFGFDEKDFPENKNRFVDYKSRDDWRRNDTVLKISMVPEVDGIYSALIRFVFRDARYVNSNAYSEEDIKSLVQEINLIYHRMKAKHPQNTITEIINGLVTEVNRRYGIVTKQERDSYEKEVWDMYNYANISKNRLDPEDRYSEPPDTEIPILPGEGEEEIVRPSAAQRLLGDNFDSVEKKRPFTVSTKHLQLIYRFRCAIDSYFENIDEDQTLVSAIKSTELKLRKEQDDEARFKLIVSLIRGVDIYSKVDGMKYVLFHETVVNGLNLLSGIHSMLARFKRRAHIIDLQTIEKKIWEYFMDDNITQKRLFMDATETNTWKAGGAAKLKTAYRDLISANDSGQNTTAARADIGTASTTKAAEEATAVNSLINYIVNYLTTEIGLAEAADPQITELVHLLFGYGECLEINGGHVDTTTFGYNSLEPFTLKGGSGIPVTGAANAFAHVSRWTAKYMKVVQVGSKHLLTTNGGSAADAKLKVAGSDGGLASVLIGSNVEDLREAYYANKVTVQNKENKQRAETFMRFIFNREWVMKELIESLFGLGQDFQGLVNIKMEDEKLYISWGGLKTLIEDMFQGISYFLEILRPHIKPEILARYTDKFNPGSFYWLQEQLMEKIVIGRPPQLNKNEGEPFARTGYASLDELLHRLSYTYERLTRKWLVDGKKLAAGRLVAGGGAAVAANLSEVSVADSTTEKNNFDKLFAELIFYDSAKPGSGLFAASEADSVHPDTFESRGGVKLVDFLHNPFEMLHFNGAVGSKIIDTRYIARFYQLYSWKDEFTLNRSTLFAFNQLVAKFLQSFYDPVSQTIYAGILNQFAQGSFNRSIADQMHTYPDTVPIWFVKFVAGGDTKIPPTTTLAHSLHGADKEKYIGALKKLFTQYLRLGIHPGDYDKPKERSGLLLKLTNSDVQGHVDILTDGSAGSMNVTPKILIYLLIHIIGVAIHDLFEYHSEQKVAANAVPVAGGVPYSDAHQELYVCVEAILKKARTRAKLPAGKALANYGDAVARYGGKHPDIPTIKNIMDKLLEGPFDNILARCLYATGGFVNANNDATVLDTESFATPITDSPLASVVGSVKYTNHRDKPAAGKVGQVQGALRDITQYETYTKNDMVEMKRQVAALKARILAAVAVVRTVVPTKALMDELNDEYNVLNGGGRTKDEIETHYTGNPSIGAGTIATAALLAHEEIADNIDTIQLTRPADQSLNDAIDQLDVDLARAQRTQTDSSGATRAAATAVNAVGNPAVPAVPATPGSAGTPAVDAGVGATQAEMNTAIIACTLAMHRLNNSIKIITQLKALATTLDAEARLYDAALEAVPPPAAFRASDSVAMINAYNNVLRFPPTPNVKVSDWGGIIVAACDLFPLQDEMSARTEYELEYRAELISIMVTNLATARDGIRTAGGVRDDADVTRAGIREWDEAYKNLSRGVTTVSSTFVPGTIGQPKYMIKYEDIITANTEHLVDKDLYPPAGDMNYLVYARLEEVRSAVQYNNIKELGINTPHPQESDELDNIQHFGRRIDPDADHILFSSLAIVLRNILSSKNVQKQNAIYIRDNVADIPLYIRERMRANLPAFRNLFRELANRCEFIKKFMMREEMSLERSYGMVGIGSSTAKYKVNIVPKHNPWPYVLKDVTTSSLDTKNRFMGILDSIIRGCMSLVTSCEQVLREVGDDPKYFELYQNSIKDYKSQYGYDPLMPLSSTLAVLKNVTKDNYLDHFPIHSLGEDPFKFMYGTRSILGQPTAQPLMEHITGFAQTIESFNLIIDTKLQADKAKADAFLKTFVKLLRYVFELKHIKGLITSYVSTPSILCIHPHENPPNTAGWTLNLIGGLFTRDDLVATDRLRGHPNLTRSENANGKPIYNIRSIDRVGLGGPIVITNRSDLSIVNDGDNKDRESIGVKRKYPIPVYSIVKNLTETIKLTESSLKEDKIKEIVEFIYGRPTGKNSLELINLRDLEIVPINVHALAREIALYSLYIYAYTFDRLIIELFYGTQNENTLKLISELCSYDLDSDDKGVLKKIQSSKDLLVALMLNPYMNLYGPDIDPKGAKPDYYEVYTKAMLSGVPNNGDLGRPKFLSDQIFNKAVFGELYPDPNDYNEMGPSASQAQRISVSIRQKHDLLVDLVSTITVRLALSLAVGGNPDNKYETTAAGGVRVLLPDNPDVEILRDFCSAIARYIVENPINSALDVFEKAIAKLFNATNAPRFSKILPVADDPGERRLVIIITMVAKLVFVPALRFVNNAIRYQDLRKRMFVAELLLSLTFLNAIGTRRTNNDHGFLGIADATGGHPAVASLTPANRQEAVERAFTYIQVNKQALDLTYGAGGGGASADGIDGPAYAGTLKTALDAFKDFDFGPGETNTDVLRTVGKDFPTALKTLFDDVMTLGDIRAGGRTMGVDIREDKFANIPKLEVINETISDVLSKYTNRITAPYDLRDQPNPPGTNHAYPESKLHWLSINRVTREDFTDLGVGVQEPPYGDNNNVMDPGQVKSIDVTGIRSTLAKVGRLRFDTKFIRNLVFIVNLYRSLRMKLQQDLTYSKDVIARAEPVVSVHLTEFFGNNVDRPRWDYRTTAMWRR